MMPPSSALWRTIHRPHPFNPTAGAGPRYLSMIFRNARPLLALFLSASLVACGSDPQARETEMLETGTPEAGAAEPTSEPKESPEAPTVYALAAQTLEGKDMSLDQYQGKVTVFVNVASQCGYTRHYAGLQKLYEELGGDNFAVVGIPSNDFGGQEPGSAEEIRAFCTQNYGVTFDMLAKTGTKEGDSPIFDRFADLTGERPGWNFCKFVVSKDGGNVKFFPSKVAPDSDELRGAIAGFMAN